MGSKHRELTNQPTNPHPKHLLPPAYFSWSCDGVSPLSLTSICPICQSPGVSVPF